MFFNKNYSLLLTITIPVIFFGQNPNLNYNKFKQLKEEVATPNVYRTASGAPGHEYYQNEADYVMNIFLNIFFNGRFHASFHAHS